MCDLYSLTKGHAAVRAVARVMIDRTGNLPLFPGIFPDYSAPIARNSTEGRDLALARWGMARFRLQPLGCSNSARRRRPATPKCMRALKPLKTRERTAQETSRSAAPQSDGPGRR